MAIELTTEQRHQAVLEEAEYQLTIMKQYLSDDEKQVFLYLVNKYAGMFEKEEIMKRYEKAWG